MLTTLLLALMVFMSVPAAFGLLVFFHVFVRKKTSPADASNRINHFRLVWFALTREEKFVDVFPWMKNDEMENIEHKNETSNQP